MKNYLNSTFDLDSDELMEVFDELPFWAAPFGIKLMDKVVLRKGISALDIGFGAGFPLTELAMRLGNSSKVYGIDPWAAAIKRTRKKISFYGIENIEIIEGVAEEIPLATDSIDLIVSNNGINNVADLEKVLSECSRIMKQGGQFVLTMNLNNTMLEFYNLLEDVLLKSEMKAEIETMNQQIYKKRKPLGEFIELLEKHGFAIKGMDQDQFDYKFVDGTALMNHHFIRMAFLSGWKSIVPVEKQEFIFNEIELRMNELAQADGFIKLSVPFVVIDCYRKS
jgi:ubiquinone/menaquinone biosynthesis C-methylase UbiE